ncbi:MAG: hypothetical protein R3E64_04220 [Halioglobus sp.]
MAIMDRRYPYCLPLAQDILCELQAFENTLLFVTPQKVYFILLAENSVEISVFSIEETSDLSDGVLREESLVLHDSLCRAEYIKHEFDEDLPFVPFNKKEQMNFITSTRHTVLLALVSLAEKRFEVKS